MKGRAILQEAVLAAAAPYDHITTLGLSLLVNRPRNKVADVTSTLVRQGFMSRRDPGVFVLTEKGREAVATGTPLKSGPRHPDRTSPPPFDNTFRQRAWNAMRICQVFTLDDIVLRAARPKELSPISNLRIYVHRLMAAGYVVETPRRSFGGVTAPSSNGHKVYRLIKDSGDIAPRATATRLTDFNEGALDV